MALSKIRNIINNMEDQELAEFLLIRLDEAKNDWGI
jgi:transcription termination factor Rho